MEKVFIVMFAFLGLLAGAIVATIESDMNTREHLNTDMQTISKMKHSCEESLPRNIECVAVLKFVPEVHRKPIEN